MSLHNANGPTIDIFKATVAATAECWHLVGSGDKNAVDGAAVDAMRDSLRGANFGGVVVIGEGEKDEAPMLFNGEIIGGGQPVEWDIAVDPVDGTALAAGGLDGAVSVMAAAQRGAMLASSEVYYMQKIVSGPAARGVLDLDVAATENIHRLAAALNKDVSEIRVAVINKPRNYDLIAEVKASGAQWVRFDEGDITMAVAAATPDSGVDLLLGIGGAPEGVVTACAVQILGGFMQTRFAPETPDEISRALGANYDLERKFELDELVSGDQFIFVCTAITDGPLARGVRETDEFLDIQSFVLDSQLGDARVLEVRVPKN
ncbi:fructose-bisphosphatase class II family protein [Rhodoluna limnophila]|uniref:fructose-bisphosphatase class II family protein n=1 Tax=Rhodoluna limnophila TaxID=232537 RepID=UPI001106B7C7|nr:fructose-bisphosphatase class II family protein [Rhodoluna limnophila]